MGLMWNSDIESHRKLFSEYRKRHERVAKKLEELRLEMATLDDWAEGLALELANREEADRRQREDGKCRSCQFHMRWERGESLRQSEINYWMMWGCSCDAKLAKEAQTYIEAVTR